MSDKKKKDEPTLCPCCARELRVQCPCCAQSVRVLDGALASHERGRNTGAYIKWETCPDSKKIVRGHG
jgi:hypothetical protein